MTSQVYTQLITGFVKYRVIAKMTRLKDKFFGIAIPTLLVLLTE